MVTHDPRPATGNMERSPHGSCRASAPHRRATILMTAIALSGLVAGCVPRPAETPPRPPVSPSPQAPGNASAATIPAGARAFEIDPAKSVVTILVNKAGPFAKFAHNHVVTSGQESGFAWEGRDPAGSGFEIHVPVAALTVDDPAVRAAIGGEFAGEVPESAREGTYGNMTRPEVLDLAEFPEVIVRCDGLAGSWDRPVAAADLTIRGATRRVEIPMELERGAGTFTARGSLHIRQSDFGITPFSAVGGAIQVGDELELRFDIVAVAR
jgi:polyisoprenoid-binding protein YceI